MKKLTRWECSAVQTFLNLFLMSFCDWRFSSFNYFSAFSLVSFALPIFVRSFNLSPIYLSPFLSQSFIFLSMPSFLSIRVSQLTCEEHPNT